MFDGVKSFYDRVFGNNDGVFDLRDLFYGLPNHAVAIVVLIADIAMLVAELRVWEVGKSLTNSSLLALGFVMVSSVPFYLGQVAYRYNKANSWQQGIAIFLVALGLLSSAYYGFADYIFSTASSVVLSDGVKFSLNVESLYYIAILNTTLLIVSGLTYGLLDDEFAAELKSRRIEGRAKIAQKEIQLKRKLVEELKKLREEEDELRKMYPGDYEALQKRFGGVADSDAGKSGFPRPVQRPVLPQAMVELSSESASPVTLNPTIGGTSRKVPPSPILRGEQTPNPKK